MKREKPIQWTPPILGWQYQLLWDETPTVRACSSALLQDFNIYIEGWIEKQTDYRRWTIKLTDLISNTRNIVQHDLSFARTYLDEKRQLLPYLTSGHRGLLSLACDLTYFGLSEIENATKRVVHG